MHKDYKKLKINRKYIVNLKPPDFSWKYPNFVFFNRFIINFSICQERLSIQHVESIAAFSKTGTVTYIISGLAIGFDSTLLPTVLIIAGILVSYFIINEAADPIIVIYGISIVSIAVISITSLIVVLDS